MNITPTETRGVFSSVDYTRISNTSQYKHTEKPVNEGPPDPSVDVLVLVNTITGNTIKKEPLEERAKLVNEGPLTEGINAIGRGYDEKGEYWLIRVGKSPVKIYYQNRSLDDYLEALRKKRIDINV